jgi:hypothetical protein
MGDEIKAKRQPTYRYYLRIRDEAEARQLFVDRYHRQPSQVLPPDNSTPYWRVGPVDEDVPAADRSDD